MVSEFRDNCKGTFRRYAVKQFAEKKFFGYLAFDGDVPVGWCNVGDMKQYPISRHQAIPDFARENACDNTLSIICFAIAPEYRGKGVASALLEHVITDAISQGFALVEGYVNMKYVGEYCDHTGPTRLYEKYVFVEMARQKERLVMRKEL